MAKKRRKPLTKAEAGRLGGKSTVRRYGVEHMRTIGKAGFQAFARKLGYMGGSRLGAIQWLQRQKKFTGQTPAQQARDQADYERLLDELLPKDEPEEEDPVAFILASIRSAPRKDEGRRMKDEG
jgi:hypothetical protein